MVAFDDLHVEPLPPEDAGVLCAPPQAVGGVVPNIAAAVLHPATHPPIALIAPRANVAWLLRKVVVGAHSRAFERAEGQPVDLGAPAFRVPADVTTCQRHRQSMTAVRSWTAPPTCERAWIQYFPGADAWNWIHVHVSSVSGSVRGSRNTTQVLVPPWVMK